MKLTKKFKKDWIKALKSGDYPKGKCHLKQKEGGVYTYCCLGVAGELCGVKGMTSKKLRWQYLDFTDNRKILRGKTNVPFILQGQAGIAEALAHINDHNETFEPVIAYIEEHL